MNLEDSKIAIIGLGYVGLTLAVEFGKKYQVLGFDIDQKRISEVSKGFDSNGEIEKKQFKKSLYLSFSTNKVDIEKSNIFIITVPTLIDENKKPDLEPLLNASNAVGSILKRGDIVIYESTVYPGCTEEDCVPVLEKKSGLKYNKDFFCGYSPERINPGDKIRTLTKIVKITSGSTPEVAVFIDKLYNTIIKAGTIKASSIKIAEASKLIENIQRYVNISLMNEFAQILDKLDLETTEVLSASSTKWNFHPYFPGLIGGNCLENASVYLANKAKEKGFTPNILLASQKTNDDLVLFVVNKLKEKNNRNLTEIAGVNIELTKPNCPSIINQKVQEVLALL